MESLVIGVTGTIGTGKSTFSRELAGEQGVHLDADALAKQLMEPDRPAYQPVVDAFGEEIVDSDGAIDFEKLGARVFSDRDQLDLLESILHPLLLEDLRHRIATGEAPYYVIDAALLLETGGEELCDLVVTVTAPEDQVRERIRDRGLPEEQIRRRRDRQYSQEEKARRADRVVRNDGSEDDLLDAARDLRRDIHQRTSITKGSETTPT